MPNCYRAIALSFGYVESNTTSWLIYYADRWFPESRKEALHSLAEYLYQKYTIQRNEVVSYANRYKSRMAQCCQKAWRNRDKDNPPATCPICKADYSVNIEYKFNIDLWYKFLKEIQISDCDSYGEHDWINNPHGWTPWMYQFNVPSNQTIVVGENAEHILTMALSEIHPELEENSELGNYEEFPDLTEDSFVYKDYLNLLNENPTPDNGEGDESSVTITTNYKNGGQAIMVDGRYTYLKYNTGDQVWVSFKDGKYHVDAIHTHDGVYTPQN